MAADKELLRELFGEEGDIDRNLEREFGGAYMDHPDDSGQDVPEELREMGFRNVTGLVDRMIEGTEAIDCTTNQIILYEHLIDYINEGPGIDPTLIWKAVKHSADCLNPNRRKISNITHMDKYLTPDEVGKVYGEDIEGLRPTRSLD